MCNNSYRSTKTMRIKCNYRNLVAIPRNNDDDDNNNNNNNNK